MPRFFNAPMHDATYARRCSLWRTTAALHLALLLVLAMGIRPCEAKRADGRRPNVVLMMADDQGWGDLSLHGNTNLATPRIDSLARDGAALERFFVCPVCSPTRAELLTGRYYPRGGVRGVSTGGERLDLDESTVAEAFQAAGYATAAYGKWHNGLQYPYHPNARGFDDYYGFCSGHWSHYFSPTLDHNGELVRGNGYLTDDFTDHALAFIEKHRQRPFFCYLPYNTPHSPMQVPDRFYEKFDGAELQMRNRDPGREDVLHTRAALAMVENIDFNVGRVLDKLDALGLAEQTIVIYLSDNGPNGWRYNGGMRGKKGWTDEGGVRVPCLVRWTGHIAPGTAIARIAGAIDLLPTLTDMAGIARVGEKRLDGQSLKPLLLCTAEAADWPDRMIFSYWGNRVSVRTQRWRLDDKGRLYDMPADPGQDRNVAGEHPEVARRLTAAVKQWKSEMLSELGRDDRPLPVGHPDRATTWLPARDGVPHGEVKRSCRHPNDSYFTNWRRADDRMTWDIEVLTAGRYEAAVYYTCPKADVGATVVLGFGEAEVRGKVAEAFDPPLVGAAEDRVFRGEGYAKDFKPLELGTFDLPARRGTLVLRAIDVPGRTVADVRYVVLRRVP